MMQPSRPTSARSDSWEEQAPLVSPDPPPWFFRALAWLLISLFVVALAASILVRVPDSVHSRFILEPSGGADPIQSPRQAVLEEVLLRPGQEVRKGQALFLLRADDVRDWRAQVDTDEQNLRAIRQRTARLEEAHASLMRIKDNEIIQVQREIDFRNKHRETMRDLVARMETLGKSGTVSEIELVTRRLDLAQSEKDLAIAQKTLAQSRIERERLATERQRQRVEDNAGARELEIRIGSLQPTLHTRRDDLLEVRAPYDGVCINVTQQNAGSVVAPGTELCQLARSGAPVQARLQLPESGLSRLSAGQRVRFFFDAFPYQRYGVSTGVLTWVSPAALTGPKGSHFVADASLDRKAFIVHGASRPLHPGMQGEARIIVGRRALIEYVFEPFRRLREDLR